MKKTLMCATAAAAFASAGLAAHAQDGWYGRADLNYGFAGRLDHDAVGNVRGKLAGDSDANENIGGDLGLGYAFDNGLRLEGTIGSRGGDLDVSNLISGTAPAGSVANPNGNIQVSDLMLNAIFDFNREGNFQPYVGVGAGGIRLKAKASNRTFGTGTNLSAANGFSDQGTGVGYQGLLGFGFKLSERLMLDLGYKYQLAEDFDFNGNHNGVDYTADYSDHSATLGLRYAFGAPAAPVPVEPPPPPVAEVVEPTPAPVVTPPPPPAPPVAPRVITGPVCSSLNQNFVVYFEWDRADLTSQASAVIDQAIANIRQTAGCTPSSVSIVGHTDSSGGNAYNDRLSARRADVVAGALTSRGIAAEVITKSARGENSLAKATRDGVKEPLNRRSEVTISVR